MLHWLHFRQQKASLWIPCSTQNATFSNGKRTFTKLRSHDDIALFAQMLHWLHFRQQRASFWTPPSTRNVTFSCGKRTFIKPRSHDDIALFAQMLHWLHIRQQAWWGSVPFKAPHPRNFPFIARPVTTTCFVSQGVGGVSKTIRANLSHLSSSSRRRGRIRRYRHLDHL